MASDISAIVFLFSQDHMVMQIWQVIFEEINTEYVM